MTRTVEIRGRTYILSETEQHERILVTEFQFKKARERFLEYEYGPAARTREREQERLAEMVEELEHDEELARQAMEG